MIFAYLYTKLAEIIVRTVTMSAIVFSISSSYVLAADHNGTNDCKPLLLLIEGGGGVLQEAVRGN